MVLLGVDNAGKTTTLEQLKALFGLKAMAPERRDIAPGVPSGYGKSPFSMGKSTISMAICNSELLNYQRVTVPSWSS
jgi:hypothetical protein